MTREEIHKLPWKAQEYINELERKLTLTDVVVPKGTLCECGGNERVALDCTMKPCKHPKYFKG